MAFITSANSIILMPNCARILTFCLIKPDLYASAWKAKDILNKLELSRFEIVKKKKVKFSLKKAKEFYAPISEKYYFERAVRYISSGSMLAIILGRELAVKEFRDIVRGTDKMQGLRDKYGQNETQNGIHASDTQMEAFRDIKFFFPHFDMNEWLKTEDIKFKSKDAH